MRILFVIALVSLAACGGSPTAPAPAVPPADLVGVAQDLILDWIPANDGWKVTTAVQNKGAGCAKNITGKLHIRDAGGQEIVWLPWTLDTTIAAGQTVLISTCCLLEHEADRAQTYSVEIAWTNVPCR